ncbi:3-hydroxy-3-methylglutaryl-coenzyme A reductase-like isoform X2 [Homarus americanus]|uniref:3-hydroxy-3-methylglutaryl-coenzyme A reductase-like isoform X2 n=1 Tax=Homarus americanus TaxID=6706 RepID=UPI001C48D25B|nr:3-hydroxy-3-methylglutaryl-coenzyme A reductase-like isoform X2 [Homarus americanus]
MTAEGSGVTWRTFWAHGRMCAGRPWEVIFSVITTTVAMISLADWYKAPSLPRTPQEYQGLDVVVMTILRCSALLYTYHQFRNLHRIGSKYIVGIAGLFVVFSSFVFSCSVIKLLDSDVSDLKDALFFFLLLVDLSRASLLAQFALSSSNQIEVHTNIAFGMARLGPSLTLDTIVEALVIGAGTLSGVSRLEQMCAFACLSILVNYIVFMTFFPACLSLVLELSNRCSSGQPPWQMATLARAMVEEEKPNPVVQRVKVIMSAGLLLVHGITRWSFSLAPNTITMMNEAASSNYSSDPHVIVRLLNAGLDHIVFTVILVALIVKYVLFESQGQLEENLIHDSLQRSQDVLENSGHFGKGFGPLGILRQRSRTRTVSFNSCREESAMAACKEDRGTQTEKDKVQGVLTEENNDADEDKPPRSLEECIAVINSEAGAKSLSNQEIVQMVEKKHLPSYKLESLLGNPLRAVGIRRTVVAPHTANQGSMDSLPYDHYDYTKVMGVCCENVIGYVPIPVGVAGPLLMNGKMYMVPMATTEGCLVASTNRGCRAMVNGVKSEVFRDGMTRAPSVRLPTAAQATEVYMWTRKKENFAVIKEGFDSTSRFARLQDLQVGIAGRLLFMRFVAQTGDAMGMNMVSKGTEAGLKALKKHFPELEVLSVSGNYCVDKKPSAINWIEGRGKSVVCESVVPGKVVTSILKTSVAAIVEASVTKNLVGSSLAGSIGGNNAHAANIIAAMFIACGQDPAQVVGSSNCMTLMEAWGEKGDDLHISVTMPSLEVGTVGGGTGLAPQSACLTMLGVKGAHKDNPGENACQLAKIVAATVLAGELSLMSALAAGHLVKSHLAHNRVKGGSSSLSSSTMPTTISSDTSGTSGITTTTPAPDGISSTKFCDVQPSGKASVGEVNSTNTCKPPAAVGDAKINAMQGDTVVSDKDSTSNIVLSPCQDPANISVPHSRDR